MKEKGRRCITTQNTYLASRISPSLPFNALSPFPPFFKMWFRVFSRVLVNLCTVDKFWYSLYT